MFPKKYCIELISSIRRLNNIGYYDFEKGVMVKFVDTLLLGSSARAARFESEWRWLFLEILIISYEKVKKQTG